MLFSHLNKIKCIDMATKNNVIQRAEVNEEPVGIGKKIMYCISKLLLCLGIKQTWYKFFSTQIFS